MTVALAPPAARRQRHDAAGPCAALDVRARRRWVASALAVAAGTALLGLLAGYAWSVVAPRALLVMVSPGAAALVQVETRAFIAADAAFCLVDAGRRGDFRGARLPAGGAQARAAGHGRRAGRGLAAAYLARWVGERSGLASFHHLLATLPAGAQLRDTLTLGASSALAFWPLAAGLIAGGLTALAADGRRGRPGAP